MLKKIIIASGLLTFLSACDQNVSASLYVRDVQDLITSNKEIPIDVTIDIFETGIAKQCSQPEGEEIVKAVAAGFENASLIGCEVIAGSMNDKMTIKATTRFSYIDNSNVPVKNLIEFEAFKLNDEFNGVNIRFNSEKYAEIQKNLHKINRMASIKIEKANISLTISNDLREPITLLYSQGVFADGKPIDFSEEKTLEPRQDMVLKFGNVKMGYLANNSWARVFAVKQTS